jgi:hypothetical protein
MSHVQAGAEPIDPAGSLTAQQAIDAWPKIRPKVSVHDVASCWAGSKTVSPPHSQLQRKDGWEKMC